MFKKISGLLILMFFTGKAGYCQDMQNLLGQVSELYKGNDMAAVGISSGFSANYLIAAILFGSIGFVAFVYGKKRSEFKPMMIGIALMVYPYFIKNMIAVYLVGILLTAALYFFRD